MTRLRRTYRAKRRNGALLALLVALCGIFVLVPSATAVHDLGLFELDRNAVEEGTAGDDWGTLFGGGGSSESFTGILCDVGATCPPGQQQTTQFQGGGSKDDLDITQWLWKEGEPLDKDDITNAYAAAYINTVDTGDNNVGDLILYYGLDRFSSNGSAQVGFWFLQDPNFGLTNTASGGGFKFSGAHQDGDVLVQSNFSQGGVIESLSVYKWQSGALVSVIPAGADCVGPPPAGGDDAACATVNRAPTPSPWPYTPKANEGSPGAFLTGAFFEGGINITRLVPEASCFANFLAETRTSTPFDARLKDFVRGTFESCEVEVTTTPSDASIVLGDTTTDKVLVEGSGLNAPTPTGTVKFYICAPDELTNGACESPDPNNPTGTLVSTETLTPTADPNDSVAEAESDAFEPDAVGTWCWRGEYSGDDFYDPDEDATAGECFLVTDTSSVATAQDWRPNDSATVTSAGGSTLNGTVAFTLYDNGTCDGNVLYTESVGITAGTASPATVNTTNDGDSPGDVLVSADATVSWLAVFASNDANVSGNTSGCEKSVLDITN